MRRSLHRCRCPPVHPDRGARLGGDAAAIGARDRESASDGSATPTGSCATRPGSRCWSPCRPDRPLCPRRCDQARPAAGRAAAGRAEPAGHHRRHPALPGRDLPAAARRDRGARLGRARREPDGGPREICHRLGDRDRPQGVGAGTAGGDASGTAGYQSAAHDSGRGRRAAHPGPRRARRRSTGAALPAHRHADRRPPHPGLPGRLHRADRRRHDLRGGRHGHRRAAARTLAAGRAAVVRQGLRGRRPDPAGRAAGQRPRRLRGQPQRPAGRRRGARTGRHRLRRPGHLRLLRRDRPAPPRRQHDRAGGRQRDGQRAAHLGPLPEVRPLR